jgi:hypothetical protein
MKKTLLAALFIFINSILFAQTPGTLWSSVYSNKAADEYDYVYGCDMDDLGNIYVCGMMMGAYEGGLLVMKINPAIKKHLWTKLFHFDSVFLNDKATSCIVRDTFLYVAGRWINDSESRNELEIIKYNTNTGDSIWAKHYAIENENIDEYFSCEVDTNGFLYVFTGMNAPILMKIDCSSGDTLWTCTFPLLSTGPIGRALTIDRNNYLYGVGSLDGNLLYIKYNDQGDTVWTDTLDLTGWNNQLAGCTIDNSSLYAVGKVNNGVNDDFAVLKINPVNGDTVWMRTYNSPYNGDDAARTCKLGKDGYLYVTGCSFDGSYYDFLTIKYDTATGNPVWVNRNDSYGTDAELAGSIGCEIDQYGNIYTIGTYVWPSQRDFDALLIKYDADTGDSLIVNRYNKPTESEDDICDGVLLGDDLLFVGGATCTNAKTLIVKYDVLTKDTLCSYRLDEDAPNSYNYPYGCGADLAGNLFISGWADYNKYLAKINMNIPDTFWVKRYDDLGMKIIKIVSDKDGSIYFAGSLDSSFAVIKFDSLCQDTIWKEPISDGSGYSSLANDIVIDETGGVYASGRTGGVLYNTTCDYFAVKLDASSGDTVWTKTFDAGSTDIPSACAVDTSGFYMAGSCRKNEDSTFYAMVVKYNKMSGDTVWARWFKLADKQQVDGNDVVSDGKGGLYLIGGAYDASYNLTVLAVKFDVITGDTIWTYTYPCSSDSNALGKVGAIDANGNLFIGGNAWSELGGDTDWLVIQLDTKTGISIEPKSFSEKNRFVLNDPSPNPFSENMRISFQLDREEKAVMKVYNISGQVVKTILNEVRTAGQYLVSWDGNDDTGHQVASGVYICELQAGNKQAAQKMIKLK